MVVQVPVKRRFGGTRARYMTYVKAEAEIIVKAVIVPRPSIGSLFLRFHRRNPSSDPRNGLRKARTGRLSAGWHLAFPTFAATAGNLHEMRPSGHVPQQSFLVNRKRDGV